MRERAGRIGWLAPVGLMPFHFRYSPVPTRTLTRAATTPRETPPPMFCSGVRQFPILACFSPPRVCLSMHAERARWHPRARALGPSLRQRKMPRHTAAVFRFPSRASSPPVQALTSTDVLATRHPSPATPIDTPPSPTTTTIRSPHQVRSGGPSPSGRPVGRRGWGHGLGRLHWQVPDRTGRHVQLAGCVPWWPVAPLCAARGDHTHPPTRAHGFARAHSTQHTAHSTQHTAHSTQHTAHSTQHTAHTHLPTHIAHTRTDASRA